MADKEACTELVDKASQEQSAGSLDGESLLLPLLQGLLDAPDKEQAGADSGTESGEDQRTNLIAEVQGALDKLSASLLSDATDISSERKHSLLQLVTKLQAGLATSLPGNSSSTSPNSHGRFGKRRQRQNRHTVGVSSEELADARKLIEEITLGDVLPSSSNGNLQKQRSEGSIIPTSSSNSSFRSISLSHSKSPVKNAIAKPFSSSNSISATSSSGNTPTDPPDGTNYLFNDEPKQDDYKIMENPLYKPEDKSVKRRSLTQAFSPPHQESIRSKTPLQGNIMVRKIKAEEEPHGSETDDDPSTLKNHQDNIPDLLMQNNAIYSFPPPQLSHEEKANKFVNRKVRMRRANTIDIPKPLNFYADNESDSDFNDEEYHRQRRHTYLALRGPIRVGNQANPSTAPPLEPKTESDKKFLAFINKHNENNNNIKTSLWSNPDSRGPVWNSKFGKIQRNFEKASKTGSASTPTPPQNSARNFWKANDDSVMAKSGYANMGPKISRQSARNLQQMFEDKQKQNQYDNDSNNVITGSLKLKTKPLEQEKVYRFVPQPLPVNQFSHAPQSAFQPISKKTIFSKPDVLNIPKQTIKEESDSESSTLFLYSPKSIQNDSSSTSSPISTKPWVGNSGEHRVLSIAASKFERPPEQDIRAPVRVNKEKITIPSYLQRQQQEEPEKLTAPYLGRSVPQKASSTVKKLSDQYSNLNSTPEQYKQYMHDGNRYVNKGLQQKNYEPYHNNNSQQRHGNNYPPQYNHQQPSHQQYNRYSRQYSQPEQYESPAYSGYNNGCYDYRNQAPRQENVIIPPMYQEPHYEDQQYNSNFQYAPQQPQPSPHAYYNNVTVPKKQQNYNVNITMENRTFIPTPTPTPSPTTPALTPTPAPNGYDDYQENRPKLETQLSGGSVHEHNAVSSRVMSGPVGQQAVTVAQKTPKSRDGHDMDAAFNLRNALQNVSKDKDDSFRYKPHETVGFKYDPLEKPEPTSPRPSSFKYRSVEDQSRVLSNGERNIAIARPIQQSNNKQSIASESVNLNSRGESVVTSKFQIPVINVANDSQKRPSSSQVLSKSDSWHQICLQNQNIAQKPLPKSSPNARTVTKSKSSHSLAVPKMFEAGIARDEVDHKKKSIEAYLGGKAPSNNKNVKRAINRTKTSEKSSSFKSTGICRSRTLPDVICPDLLDESNVEEAFDDLFKASS